MNAPKRTGFTLAELMVVVLVIGLIAAIVLPFFQRAFAVQRKVTCANNLEKIGQAYHTRLVQGATRGLQHSGFAVITWQQTLLPFVGDSAGLFECPEDKKEHTAAQGAQEKLKQIYIEVFDSDAHLGNYSYHLWDVPLDEEFASEWVWRLSQEQFNDFVNTPNHGQNYKYKGYQEGADPTTYWFVFEDQGYKGGGDKDYYDVMLNISIADTEIVITPEKGAAGYSFTLAMGKGAKKEILIKDVEGAHRKPLTIEGAFGSSSYGMNSMAGEIPEGSPKLLVVDYEKTIARGSDFDDPDGWLEDAKLFPTKTVGQRVMPAFFRHFDKCNMLLGNGAVRNVGFDDISIYDDAAREKYWNPRMR